MPRICINCGSKLVEGSPCDCMESATNTTSQVNEANPDLAQNQMESESVAENVDTSSKKVQINIDQEMVDKYIDETKKYLGIGIASFTEFIKKPLSMTMHSQLSNAIIAFFIVLQASAFMLLEVILVSNVQRIFEELVGSLAYWFSLSDHINYVSMCLKGGLMIVISMATLTLLMSIASQKIGKVETTFKSVLSMAVVSTIPMTLGYLGGAIMLFIVPVASLLCVILGIISSIILGSYTLLSIMDINKDKGTYVVTGLYVVQAIFITIILRVTLGM